MKIVVTHGYSDSNKGDVAIALGTVAALRRVLPAATVSSHSIYSEEHLSFRLHSRFMSQAGIPVVEGVFPSPYLEDHGSGFQHNLKAVLRLAHELFCLAVLWFMPFLTPLHPRKAHALQEIRQADLVIVRGGQYLHNESGRIRGNVYLGRMLLNIAIPICLKRPTVIWGLSIGPVYGRLATVCLRETLRACRYIVVRERLSADYLGTLGISRNVMVSSDLAFLTIPSSTPRVEKVLPMQSRIAVTAINWSFPRHPQPHRALANYLEAVFSTLVSTYTVHGLVPVFVMQVTAQHHGQHDYPVVLDLLKRLRSIGVPAHLVDEDLTPSEISYLYGQCEVVLATRLHAIILAACAGTPSVAIRYQGFKTQGIMNGLGLAQYTHDIDNLSTEGLRSSVSQILSRRQALSSEIRARVNRYREDIDIVSEQIAKMAVG